LSSLLLLPVFLSPPLIFFSVVITVVILPSAKTYFSHFSNAKLINYEKLVNLSTKNCTNAVLSGSLLMHWSCITKKSVIFNWRSYFLESKMNKRQHLDEEGKNLKHRRSSKVLKGDS